MKRIKIVAYLLILVHLILLNSCDFKGGAVKPLTNPNIPNSPIPIDGSKNVANILDLKWQAEGAQYYDLFFDSVNPPQKKIATDIDTNKYTLVASKYSTNYYWKIVAKYSNGNSLPGPVWRFTTNPQGTLKQGFILKEHNISSELPNLVKILFQVSDLNGVGNGNLTATDFYIFEDSEAISLTESNLSIKKRQQYPYTLQTILLLDNGFKLKDDIDQIKSAALNFIDMILPQQEIAVYEFSNTINLLQDFTSDKSRLNAALNSYSVGDSTKNLYGAIIESAAKMNNFISSNNITQTAMIFFTGGNDTHGSKSLDDALNAIEDKRVYAISLGTDIDQNILLNLGNSGFFPIAEATELSNVFETIQNQLNKFANSFYWLSYSSTKVGNFDHALQLTIRNNSNRSSIIGTFNSSGFFQPEKPGLYINANSENPNGILNDNLASGEIKIYTVINYQLNNLPVYIWENLTPTVLKINTSALDNSQAEISAKGKFGDIGQVKITDSANNETIILQINIK